MLGIFNLEINKNHMGNWSKNIIGGDQAWDVMSEIFDFCGVEQYPEDANGDELPPGVLSAKILEANQWLMVSKFTNHHMNYQVLGVMMLNAGAKFLPRVSDLVINALENDDYARKSLERKIHVDDMIAILKHYITLEHPEPTKESSIFNDIDGEDIDQGKNSTGLATLAVKLFSDYCVNFPIIKAVKLGYNRTGYSYNLVCVIDDSDTEKVKEFMNLKTFDFNGLFDFNVVVIGDTDFNII